MKSTWSLVTKVNPRRSLARADQGAGGSKGNAAEAP